MPNSRKTDQCINSFSLPLSLLQQSKRRAAEMGFTTSGFYRYCLAKTLGYSEETAMSLAAHAAVTNSLNRARAQFPDLSEKLSVLNDKPANEYSVTAKEKS